MMMRTIHGDDDINGTLNGAMDATLRALVADGFLSQRKADEFADTHACMLMPAGGFKGFLARLGLTNNEDIFACVRVSSATTCSKPDA